MFPGPRAFDWYKKFCLTPYDCGVGSFQTQEFRGLPILNRPKQRQNRRNITFTLKAFRICRHITCLVQIPRVTIIPGTDGEKSARALSDFIIVR